MAKAITLVDNFYGRLWADHSLDRYFAGIDRDTLKKHQRMFLTYVLGGPNNWAVNADTHLTVVLVNKGKVVKSFAFTSVNETDVCPAGTGTQTYIVPRGGGTEIPTAASAAIVRSRRRR